MNKPSVKEMFDYVRTKLCRNMVGVEISPRYSRSRFDVVEIFLSKRRVKIYEVKSCRADFASDNKWEKYLKYCTNFGFVAPKDVIKPEELPGKVGLVELSKPYKDKTKIRHDYVKKFGRINKKVDDENYLELVEGFASSMSWRFQRVKRDFEVYETGAGSR